MKKLFFFIIALSYLNSYSQEPIIGDSTYTTNISLEAKDQHENLYEIIIRAEDMITMLSKDVTNNYIDEYYSVFYDKLLNDIIKLASTIKINNSNLEDDKIREKFEKTTGL
jgi:hypothetical protein